MIITQTPLRISLFGGGTDLPAYYLAEGGCVLTTAIDKCIYVIAKKRFDSKLRISYTKTELVDCTQDIQHDLIRESLRESGIGSGIEVITIGEIPSEGSGLGSSSTVTVGTLLALATYLGENPSSEILANTACQIELKNLKKPIGVQDQYIAAYGGIRYFEFNQDGSRTNIKLSPTLSAMRTLNDNLMLFYTGQSRKAESILSEQNQNIGNKLFSLRLLKQLTSRVYSDLLLGNLSGFGEALHESWKIKRDLASGVTDGRIDLIYERARKAGAEGGKLCGAGGGGFMLLYVPHEKQDSVRAALSPLQEMPFNINAPGARVILNY